MITITDCKPKGNFIIIKGLNQVNGEDKSFHIFFEIEGVIEEGIKEIPKWKISSPSTDNNPMITEEFGKQVLSATSKTSFGVTLSDFHTDYCIKNTITD